MTKRTVEKLLKPVGTFITCTLLGCNFVGMGNDGEVFVSFESDDPDIHLAAKQKIKEEFGDSIGPITTVAQTRLEDLQELVDDLNKALEQQEKQSQPQLLDIGEF